MNLEFSVTSSFPILSLQIWSRPVCQDNCEPGHWPSVSWKMASGIRAHHLFSRVTPGPLKLSSFLYHSKEGLGLKPTKVARMAILNCQDIYFALFLFFPVVQHSWELVVINTRRSVLWQRMGEWDWQRCWQKRCYQWSKYFPRVCVEFIPGLSLNWGIREYIFLVVWVVWNRRIIILSVLPLPFAGVESVFICFANSVPSSPLQNSQRL